MKKLSESALFNEVLSNPKLVSNIKNISIERDKVDLAMLEEPLSIISKKLSYPTKNSILSLLNSGKICIVYNPEISLPRYLNVLGKSINGNTVIIVDISKYANIRGNELNIYTKTLYGLLQNALVLYELNTNEGRYINNMTLIKESAVAYSKMVCKILDKNFAINIEPIKSDVIAFYVAKYFLSISRGLGNQDTTNGIAYNACFNGSKQDIILDYETNVFSSDYCDDIFTFFKNLAKIDGLHNLQIRTFVEQYVRMFGEGTIMGLDYFPSFLGVMFSSYISSAIHKDYIIDNLVGKNNSKMYNEFCKLL